MTDNLPNTWRSALNTVAETVFPAGRTSRQPERERILHTGTYVTTDLPLQVALYFNVWYAPFWLVICLVNFIVKYERLDSIYKFVMIVVYIVMSIVEVARLYLGFAGNLQERVPELAGFWLTTFILQFPLTLMLLFNENALIMPLERAANIVMIVFIVVEVFQGYRTGRRMLDNQVAKFHLRQFDDLIEMEEIQGKPMKDYAKLD